MHKFDQRIFGCVWESDAAKGLERLGLDDGKATSKRERFPQVAYRFPHDTRPSFHGIKL